MTITGGGPASGGEGGGRYSHAWHRSSPHGKCTSRRTGDVVALVPGSALIVMEDSLASSPEAGRAVASAKGGHCDSGPGERAPLSSGAGTGRPPEAEPPNARKRARRRRGRSATAARAKRPPLRASEPLRWLLESDN